MATFFGEVISLRSRAVDDEEEDEEDEIENSYSKEIKWINLSTGENDNSEVNIECSVLIIGIGSISCGFLKTYVKQPDQPIIIGRLCLTNNLENNLPHTVFNLYRSSKEIITCLCEKHVPPDDLIYICDQLLNKFSREKMKILILSSQHSSNYYSHTSRGSEMFPLLRCLKTSRLDEKMAVPFLEQPNTVSGFPAAVLTFCQVHNIPAVLYVLYTDVMDVDSVNMNSLTPILNLEMLQKKIQINKNPLEEIKKKFKDSNIVHTNLYI